MPCIETKLSVSLSEDKEKILKTKFGEAISLLPGKSENFLMVSFEDNCHLYFKGQNTEPIAFVEVKIFGKSTNEAYEKLTASLCDILNREIGISPTNIYVKYEEVSHWGWNSSNF
jgi:Macrophage migration inhibitory factor (MIF).